MNLFDTFIMDSVRRTSDGYLTAFARVARTGIQEYKGHEVGRPDMETVRVYRPAEEVFAPDAMKSFAHRPVTLTHPRVPVTAKNWKRYAGGQTGGEVVRDSEFIRVPLVMMDSNLIDAYEKGGIKELSMGYSTELKWDKGITTDGEAYDAIQTEIRGNHLALVPTARGGDQLRIGDKTSADDPDDDEDDDDLLDADLSAKGREKEAESGAAMPDGSFPIKSAEDVKHAAEDWGRAGSKPDVKAHIIKRAKAIGAESSLPSTWTGDARPPGRKSKPRQWRDAEKGARVKLDDPGDHNHGKVGVVLGQHPTDPNRTRVKFGTMTTSHPQSCLTAYDAKSTDLISCPECGADVPADADDCPSCGHAMSTSTTRDGDINMKTITIDGVPVNVADDQGAAIIDRHVTQLSEKIKDQKAKIKDAEAATEKANQLVKDSQTVISVKDGEIAVLKKKVEDAAITPEKLDVMVKDRMAVIDRAALLLDKNFSYDGKKVEDIRRAAATKYLGDAVKDMTDDQVIGVFLAATKDAKDNNSGGTQPLRRALSHQTHTISDAAAERDQSYEDSVKRLADAWKTPAARAAAS
jgi:hypothetical protein